MKDNDKVMAAAFSVVLALVMFMVLVTGYIAIFKYRDCVTRSECYEIVDSVLIQIYD